MTSRSRRLVAAVVVVVALAGAGVGTALAVAGSGNGGGNGTRRVAGPTNGAGSTSTSTSTTAATSTSTTAATSTSNPTSTPSTTSTTSTPHVMLVVMENHGYDQIVGNPTAPYLNGLIARYGLATSSYAWTHPSLPNYLDLVSGSDQGISSDCTTCTADAPQLVDQLQARGIGWQALIESMPGACATGGTTLPYDRNHNPFVYAPHLVHDPAECSHVVPYRQLGPELSAGTAPPFLWVTPNVDHDMHTGTVAQGDAWLSQQLPVVMGSSWYRAGGVVIVTFDEGVTNAGCCGGAAGGHVATVVVSAATPHGARLATPVDHAGVLRTIESLYGLPFLGDAAKPASGSLLPLLGGASG